MFGAIIYLPFYLQVARGVSPTVSGLLLLPLMAGVFTSSIASGQVISRLGRYKVFPVVGTALMTLGMWQFSTLGAHTSSALAAFYMVVTGVGLGGVMQVLVLAVQNGVEYRDLGTATALATFFRSMGGAFGTAVFGAILADRIVPNLVRALPVRLPPARLHELVTVLTAAPSAINAQPGAVRRPIVAAYVHSIDTVFLVAVPIAALAFLASLVLPEIRLRRSIRTAVAPEAAEVPPRAPDAPGAPSVLEPS